MSDRSTEKERTAISNDPDLIGMYRLPLTPKRAGWLMAQVIEHPEHVITVEKSFLVMRFPPGKASADE